MCVGLLIVGAALLGPGSGRAARLAPPLASPAPTACPPIWHQVPVATAGGTYTLYALAAHAADDVWAVGDVLLPGQATQHTVILHWDGTAWSAVPTPDLGPYYSGLYGVAAVAANDAWAVGEYDTTPSGGNHIVIEHWDGAAWSFMADPSPGHLGALDGVTALTTGNVWAVGAYAGSAMGVTLVEHWDGTQWTVVPSPNVDPSTEANVLSGLAARAANDLWAVGFTAPSSEITVNARGLVEHWDGVSWQIVPSANAVNRGTYLAMGATAAPNDVWAVGSSYGSDFLGQTFTEHWDGVSWQQMASPNPADSNSLGGVVAIGPADVWAVGSARFPLVLHWDGLSWRQAASPLPGPGVLASIAALAPNHLWAIGRFAAGTTSVPLAEEYAPDCGPTPTPPVYPSPTPTACAGFSDVHPADYFYTPVQYLVSHGVIAGYSDCTFRPYANTTRSQMVKIVVLGFNKPITTPPPGSYTFADVPSAFPFFPVIETAAALQIVSGYACGQAPAGPCDGQNRPYFLPYANVTRGQLSKIDVVAAAWPLRNPATPTFSDVAPGSAFYAFVETAACHGVISGYADGTFRPGNTATRGQIAKIVDLSITGNPTGCPAPTAGP